MDRNSKLRILQFVTTLRLAGAEKLASDLSIALRQNGHEVVVAAYTDERDTLAQKLRDNDVEVVPVAFPKPGLRALMRTVLDMQRLIRRVRPDVIHAHNPAAGTIALFARTLAWQRKIPIVTTYHGVRPHRLRLAGHVISRAEAVIAVGPSAAAQLREALPGQHVVEIKNAVIVERTRPPAEVKAELGVVDNVHLVTVGRYVEQKNQTLLVDMVAELRRRGTLEREPALTIVGHGPLQEDIEAHAAGLGLSDCVTLTGPRADANDIMAAADVLVHGATWEGLPLVLLEAMSLGVPIVAADAPGVDDIIHDRVTGLLVKAPDPEAMADAVEEMLANDLLREAVAVEAESLVAREYPLSAMVEQHAELYRSLVEHRFAGS